jgi:hypothetical protein
MSADVLDILVSFLYSAWAPVVVLALTGWTAYLTYKSLMLGCSIAAAREPLAKSCVQVAGRGRDDISEFFLALPFRSNRVLQVKTSSSNQ